MEGGGMGVLTAVCWMGWVVLCGSVWTCFLRLIKILSSKVQKIKYYLVVPGTAWTGTVLAEVWLVNIELSAQREFKFSVIEMTRDWYLHLDLVPKIKVVSTYQQVHQVFPTKIQNVSVPVCIPRYYFVVVW